MSEKTATQFMHEKNEEIREFFLDQVYEDIEMLISYWEKHWLIVDKEISSHKSGRIKKAFEDLKVFQRTLLQERKILKGKGKIDLTQIQHLI